jgi:hypothetical protein
VPYGERDVELWKKWHRGRQDADLQALLQQLDPLVQSEVNRWAGSLARPLLELDAKRLAAEAIQSYDPHKGAALGTHVANRLKKLSRLSYTHQNIGRIPEHQTLKFHSFQLSQENLKDKLGRDPTTNELSEDLGWSKPYLDRFQRSMRKEFVESGAMPPIFDSGAGDSGMIDFAYNDMNPMHKKMFEHTTGYGGAKILDNQDLMKKLKLTQGQYSYQKRQLVDQLEQVLYGPRQDDGK